MKNCRSENIEEVERMKKLEKLIEVKNGDGKYNIKVQKSIFS